MSSPGGCGGSPVPVPVPVQLGAPGFSQRAAALRCLNVLGTGVPVGATLEPLLLSKAGDRSVEGPGWQTSVWARLCLNVQLDAPVAKFHVVPMSVFALPKAVGPEACVHVRVCVHVCACTCVCLLVAPGPLAGGSQPRPRSAGSTLTASTRSAWSGCLQRGARRRPPCPPRAGPRHQRPALPSPRSEAPRGHRLRGAWWAAGMGREPRPRAHVCARSSAYQQPRCSLPSWGRSSSQPLRPQGVSAVPTRDAQESSSTASVFLCDSNKK